ncbi:MAG: Hint domain-containing protein [Pseudomonadota bacterium]
MGAIDGDSGFIVAGDQGTNSASSFTAPCFAPGTLILTVDGELPVEDLAIGDLIMTADHGAQPLRWMGKRRVVFGTPETNRQKPIEIKAGALGGGMPRRALVVSPQHRMVLPGPNGAEVLCLAKGLTGLANVLRMAGKRATTYYALLFDRHEVVYAGRRRDRKLLPRRIHSVAASGNAAR